jgi:hypothetical protein
MLCSVQHSQVDCIYGLLQLPTNQLCLLLRDFHVSLLQIKPSDDTVPQVNDTADCSNSSFNNATKEIFLSHEQQQQGHDHTRGSILTNRSNTSDPTASDSSQALLNSSSSSRNASVTELVQLPRPDPADADIMFRQDLLVLFTPQAAASVGPVANSTE